jgi:DNA-binding protein Fis
MKPDFDVGAVVRDELDKLCEALPIKRPYPSLETLNQVIQDTLVKNLLILTHGNRRRTAEIAGICRGTVREIICKRGWEQSTNALWRTYWRSMESGTRATGPWSKEVK